MFYCDSEFVLVHPSDRVYQSDESTSTKLEVCFLSVDASMQLVIGPILAYIEHDSQDRYTRVKCSSNRNVYQQCEPEIFTVVSRTMFKHTVLAKTLCNLIK